MRRVAIPGMCALLAACVPAGAPDQPAASRAAQEAACTQVIAAHIRRPPEDVTSRWLSVTDGIADVEAIDGTRRHVCKVDATGRVIDYLHPGA